MKNKIVLISALLAGIFILSSCLKDENHDYWKDDVAGKMYATILSPGFHAKSILPVPDDVEVSFMVNVASDELPTKDVTMTFALDDAAVLAYAAELKAAAIANKDTFSTGVNWGKLKWKDYKPYPSIVLLTPTVTIPAGSRTGVVKFKINRADTLTLGSTDNNNGNYMSIITMTSASIPIASNMKTVMYSFPLANAYEGDYMSEGFRNHPVNGIEPFKYSKLHFSTINGTTVHKTQVGNYGGYGLDITVTENTMVVYGVTVYKCNLQVTDMANPADMIQYTVDNDGNPTNYYNPITRVFELYYAYNVAAPRKLRETDSRI